MRVRKFAAVGVMAAVAWAGGAGFAQASPESIPESEACPPPFEALAFSEVAAEPCGVIADVAAEIGCLDETVLSAWIEGLEAEEKVRLVVDGEAGDLFPADGEGEIVLLEPFDPAADVVTYEVQLEDGTVVASGTQEVVDTCTGQASLKVTGDCAEPETLTFELAATELAPDTEYEVAYISEGFTFDPNSSALPALVDSFTTDAQGAGKVTTKVTESAQVAFATGRIAIVFLVADTYEATTSVAGLTDLEACAVAPAPQPGTTPPPATTPVAAPVVVTPVAAHPAVLANTGAPVTSAALLGGGLLVAGAGALVATRRRAS